MDKSMKAKEKSETDVHDHLLLQSSPALTQKHRQSHSHLPVSSSRETQTVPCTPQRQTQRAPPNSGKRRAPPTLNRRSPGTSHRVQMSTIFEDASQALYPALTPRPLSTSARRLRMPLAETGPSLMINSKTLPSSPPQMDDGGYPDLADLKSSVIRRHFTAIQNTPTCESDLCSALPGIQDWLQEAHDHDPPPPSTKLPVNSSRQQLDRTPSPSKIPLPSTGPFTGSKFRSPERSSPSLERSSPSLERSSPGLERSTCKSTRFSSRLTTPRGKLTDPPRRKMARLSPSNHTSLTDHDRGFEIYEDDSGEKMVELSPSVQKHRKGWGPRRERCSSYWDDDFVPGARDKDQEKGGKKLPRQVLGELPALSEAKRFIDGVEDEQFDFKVVNRPGVIQPENTRSS